MKKIVWLSTSSRVSWLQVWKQMQSWLSLPFSTCWSEDVTSAWGREEGTQKKQLLFWNKGPRLCISKCRANSTESWIIGIEHVGGRHQKFSGCTWYEAQIRQRKGPSRGVHDKQIVPAKQRGTWREYLQSQSRRQLRLIFLWRRQRQYSMESWWLGIERFGGTHLKFSGCTWCKIEFGKQEGQSGGIIPKCAPHERNPCSPDFEDRTPEETSRQEEYARRVAWNLARKICKLKAEDRATFYSHVKIKAPVLVFKNTEEHMFVVDPGASMHMLSKKDLSSDENGHFAEVQKPYDGGDRKQTRRHKCYVHDLYLFVTVQLLEETWAVLSLGKLCSQHGCSYEWKNGETPCKIDNFVPLVVPGLSSSSSSSSSFHIKTEGSVNVFWWIRSINRSNLSDSEGDAQKNGCIVFMLTFHKNQKRSILRSEKYAELDNSRAQNPQRRMWISEQSPIRCRGTSSRHSVKSVSNQNFTGDGEEFTKVLTTVAEAKSCSYLQFIIIWQVMWRIIMQSSTNYTPSIRDKLSWRTSISAIEKTSAVLLQSGSDDKWRLDSMECCCCLREYQDLLADGKSQNERRFGESFQHMLCSRGEFGKKKFNWKSWTHQKFIPEDWMQKKSWLPTKTGNL